MNPSRKETAMAPIAPGPESAPAAAPANLAPAMFAEGVEPGIIGKLMLEAFGASDAGCVRNNNEDYYLVAPAIGLYIVADGMGGAQAGEHASKLAAETLWE